MKRDWLHVASIERPTVKRVLEVASDVTGLTRAELLANRRWKKLVEARDGAILAAYKLCPVSLTTIGKIVNRDHSTLVYAIKRARENPVSAGICDKIMAELAA